MDIRNRFDLRRYKRIITLLFCFIIVNSSAIASNNLTNTKLSVNSQQSNVMTKAKQTYLNTLKKDTDNYYTYLQTALEKGKELTPAELLALRKYQELIDVARNSVEKLNKKRQTILYNDDLPPTVIIAQNHLTTIQFSDTAGNPYPIQSYKVSDQNAFNVNTRITVSNNSNKNIQAESSQNTKAINYRSYTIDNNTQPPAQVVTKPIIKRNTLPASMLNSLTINGRSKYANGDLIVYLVDKQMPVHIFLESSIKAYDYQVNMTVDGLTAESLAEVQSQGQGFGNPSDVMMQFLNATGPKGSTQLDISLMNSMVWKYENQFYIRTKSKLQSPAYISRVSTSTGYTVYEVNGNTHVLQMVDHGQIRTAYISKPLSADNIGGESYEG